MTANTAVTTSKPVQVNSATCIMGLTGAGKTSLLATAAEYAYDTHRKVMLLYSFAGGGFPTKVTSLVRLGIIRIWRGRTRGEAFETTMRAAQGWWPSRINPTTGETAPGVRLVPPVTQRFTMYCPNGHVVKVVPFANQLTPQMCGECKVHTTLQNAQVQKASHRTKGFEAVGVVAFADITSMLNWQMEDMASRHARQEIKGEETALGGRVQSGDLLLGGNNRSHYGFVQTRASEMVHASNGIPGLVLPPLWTGLTLETLDEGGISVVGLKLAGKAKTDEAGAWFGNCLEVSIELDDTGNQVRRLSLNEFVDAQGRKHLIKHRGSPNMPPYLQDAPGAPWSQVNLGYFFDLLEKDVQQDAQAQAERFTDVPGMPEGEMAYGDDSDAPAPTQGTGGQASPAPVAAAGAGATGAAGKPVTKPGRVAKPRTMPQVPQVPQQAAVQEPVQPAPEAAAPTEPVTEEEPPLPLTEAGADPAVVQPQEPVQATPAAPAPTAPAAPAAPVQAPVAARPVPVPGRVMAPPPGPRPPATAPRRPPRTPPVPVGAK